MAQKLGIKTIEEKIKELMEKEDVKDAGFRYVIAATEFGDMGKYISHDPILNPNARPHGSKQDEVLAYGQVLVQIIALAQLRGISLNEALTKGLGNWEASDWRKSEAKKEGKIEGITACNGFACGKAYVALTEEDMKNIPYKGSVILVTRYAKAEVAKYLIEPYNTDYPIRISGCITDHGGKTCHLANIVREYNIPCIVGTGNATELLKTGDEIILDATNEKGEVRKVQK